MKKIKKPLLLLTLLTLLIGCMSVGVLTGCDNQPSNQQYHFDENNKLIQQSQSITDRYIDSNIKYLHSNYKLAQAFNDSSRKYNNITGFIINNNPLPK